MKHSILSVLMMCAVPALADATGDAAAGRIKASTCTGCHGIPGYHNTYPTYKVPKIAGQDYSYLVAALQAYRNGERDHRTMRLQAQSLSEQDIQDISAWLASLTLGTGAQ